jgi:hypothetical protein
LLEQAQSPNVIVSMTRCGFKLRELRQAIGSSTLLHVSREPVGWIRSHLFPTERGWSYARQRLISRLPLLRGRAMPRDYSLDVVVASPAFAELLGEAGVSPRNFRRLTAAQRLHLLWLLHEKRVELDASAAWDGSRKLISYGEFVRAPEHVVVEALALAGVEASERAIHDACAHVRAFDAFRPPASITRRIARDLADLRLDPAIDTSLTAGLAQLHGAPANAA